MNSLKSIRYVTVNDGRSLYKLLIKASKSATASHFVCFNGRTKGQPTQYCKAQNKYIRYRHRWLLQLGNWSYYVSVSDCNLMHLVFICWLQKTIKTYQVHSHKTPWSCILQESWVSIKGNQKVLYSHSISYDGPINLFSL